MSIKDRYVYLTAEKEDQTCVGIKGGKFAGVVLKYSDVTIAEQEDENGNMPFKFKFDIIDNNAIPKEDFKEDFMNLIGDILVDIIEEQNAESDNRKDSSN